MALTTCEDCGEEISKKATSCPKCGAPRKVARKTSLFTWLVLFGFLYWLVSETGNVMTDISSPEGSPPQSSMVKETKRLQALNNTDLNFTWNSDFNVMTGTFTITNKNDFEIKDIEIKCYHYAPSGTLIDSNTRTVYEKIPAKGKKTLKDFNMGFIHSQANKSGCIVENIVF